MSTTSEAPAPVDPRSVVTEQTTRMHALDIYNMRGHAARLAAIDDHVAEQYPPALGASTAAAGEEARGRMRQRLAEDVKAEAAAEVQGYQQRRAVLADAIKAASQQGDGVDHARVQTLSAELTNRLAQPPVSGATGADDRLAAIYSDWQRASLTGDADLAYATRIVGHPVVEAARRANAYSPGSSDGQMATTLSAAFREHSGVDQTAELLAAHEDMERLGLQLGGMLESMQVVATGLTAAGLNESWAAGLAGSDSRQLGVIMPSGLGLSRGG